MREKQKEGKVFYTRLPEELRGKRMEHMMGEELLREGLHRGFGLDLSIEPRSRGEYGKPFFTRRPELHYNISHSGNLIYLILAPVEVGIDVQEHRILKMERLLRRIVPEEIGEWVVTQPNATELFFEQWVLREAFVKWTGEGLSRDLKTLPLEDVWHETFIPEAGYSGAIYSACPLVLTWEELKVSLPEKKRSE